MFSENISFKICKVTFRTSFIGMLFNKFRILSVRNETDILTVRLSGVYKTCLLGDLSDLSLFITAQREKCLFELMLGEAVENIGLILRPVSRSLQIPSSSLLIVLLESVVTGCDIVKTKLFCSFKHLVELDMSVALDTRIRCTS